MVNGVQGSLQSLFQSASYGVALVVWQPEDFEWLMLGSCGVVLSAGVIFTLWADGCTGAAPPAAAAAIPAAGEGGGGGSDKN